MKQNYDVIIVGSGIAGLYAAINLDPKLSVLLISKAKLTLCNSSLAQGGVAAVHDDINDCHELHFHDTMIAGSNQNNPDALKILVREGTSDVKRLEEIGVEFDKKPDGEVHLTLEGGHSRPRIWHYKDHTGRAIENCLIDNVSKLPNVEIAEYVHVCDIKNNNGYFTVSAIDNDIIKQINCTFCILATGGIGRVYEYTTNSSIATGDGIMFAYNMGAEIKNLSYIQFHPTAFANKNTRECFLISEAVRGEGAYLLNCNGYRFMFDYDKRLELAPRDVVSNCIIDESIKTGSDNFYLDISHKPADFVKNRFPMIYENLLKEGFDLTKDRIPIYPCHHYLMGGINVNTDSETNINNLYAVGECSHTGVHGKNRLASNSLLEALVFSRHAAEHINQKDSKNHVPAVYKCDYTVSNDNRLNLPTGIRTEVRSIMQKCHFVKSNPAAAKANLERIKHLKDNLYNTPYSITPAYVEAKALTTVAYIVLNEVAQNNK